MIACNSLDTYTIFVYEEGKHNLKISLADAIAFKSQCGLKILNPQDTFTIQFTLADPGGRGEHHFFCSLRSRYILNQILI